MTSTTASREERILVLYGSQSGTAEAAAEKVCALLPEKVSTTESTVQVVGPMALDDFLQDEAQLWTQTVLIIVSSFGMGHAPKNCRQFRKLCEAWTEHYSKTDEVTSGEDKTESKPLKGLQFALLGLGSSFYKTYQKNPTIICEGLEAAGATLIGDKGSADSSAGSTPQHEQIAEWRESIWKPLSEALNSLNPVLSEEQLKEMKIKTVVPS